MHKFTSIGAVYNVRRTIAARNEVPEASRKIHEPVKYRGTVKIHGCNAGVVVGKDVFSPQSRKRAITPQGDHMGFAKFACEREELIRSLVDVFRVKAGLSPQETMVVFGEWCGRGIQGGMAVSEVDRHWALFGTAIIRETELTYLDILTPFEERYQEHRIFSILDVPSWEITIDYSDHSKVEEAAGVLGGLTEAVENTCPWGKKFGIQGLGEGLVWTPVDPEHLNDTDIWFKTKGRKHKTARSKERVQIDAHVAKSIKDFVNFAVTEARLNQGIFEIKTGTIPLEKKNVGKFIKWVSKDVKKECKDDLEASGLAWKQVSGDIATRAREFFFKYLETQP